MAEENPFLGLAGKRDAIERRKAEEEQARGLAWVLAVPTVREALQRLGDALWKDQYTISEGNLSITLEPKNSEEMVVVRQGLGEFLGYDCCRYRGLKLVEESSTNATTEVALTATLLELFPEFH